ncbi:MAG: cold shock domain-containing protein [Bacteroidia bacterium]
MSNIHIGNIIYWNPTLGYGFIECSELSSSIFFHKSNCTYENLQLFDKVSFQTSIANSKKHKGKKIAIDVNLLEIGNFKNYDLRIGTIQNWNGKFGFIDYPTDGKKIFLFHTRLLNSKNIQNDDLVIFNPIVSSKDTTQLFAFFAYPISFEKDVSFLKSQYEKYQIPALKDYILNISNDNELTLTERFELELMNLGFVSTSGDYLNLAGLLKRYSKDFSFTADFVLLSKYVSDTYLIQLWESDIINSYDINTIKEYFIRAKTDTKRAIIQKLKEADKEVIFDKYFLYLQNLKKLERINNDLKTLLDIIYRNEKTRNRTLYEKVKQYLLSTLTPDDLIDLWLHDYIDGLSESFVVKNFNIGDKNSIKLLLQRKDTNGKPKYVELISKIYEQYFIDIAKGNLDFEQEYPNLVKYLKIFEDEFKDRYIEIIGILQNTLKPYQQFVLWVLGINIELDAFTFVQQNIDEINHYYRLKFTLRYLNENLDIQGLLDLVYVDLNGLKDFAIKYKWNDVIYPTIIIEREDTHSFLNDVIDYNSKSKKDIDNVDLADAIYNSIEKFNEVHIRLWMYDYLTDKKYYDYIGFRQHFKNLSNRERAYFRSKTNEKDFDEIIEQEITEVKPCINYEQKNETTKTYNAFVENIYFGNGFIKLRLENKDYTEQFNQEYSSTGLNRIPASHYLNKIPMKIEVESDKVIEVIGLDDLFSLIHTGEIKKALGTVIEGNERNSQNYTYTEDWQLRKQVIDYLNANQDKNIETIIVNEPKNIYRRLDENSGIDDFEKTELFTIKIGNEYAIVWENIDLSEDRATYIFKCLKENHSVQIQKISNAIASLAQFRSTLSSAKDENELYIFKNNFGFITSIRKQRGKNKPFSNWLAKLENALIQQIPELPIAEELKRLKNWTPNIPHTARINKSQQRTYVPSAVIREKDLAKTDIFAGAEQNDNDEQLNETNSVHNVNQLSLLNTLKTFNQYFTKNLNFKKQ